MAGRPLKNSQGAERRIRIWAVESRHAWGMWCREGTLLDPTLVGGITLLPQNFRVLIV